MQYLTLRRAKEDAENTVAATERTARITALSSATTIWEQGLREDLATFATLAYEVETAYRWAMDNDAPWPQGDDVKKVAEEATIFNRVKLRLDRDVPSERDLIASVEAMREDKGKLWVDRREHLVDAAVAAFRSKWAGTLYGEAIQRR